MRSRWVFAEFTQVDPKLEMVIVFLFLRYWGLCHIWDMWNTFVFDGSYGWSQRISTKVKGSIDVAIFFIRASKFYVITTFRREFSSKTHSFGTILVNFFINQSL